MDKVQEKNTVSIWKWNVREILYTLQNHNNHHIYKSLPLTVPSGSWIQSTMSCPVSLTPTCRLPSHLRVITRVIFYNSVLHFTCVSCFSQCYTSRLMFATACVSTGYRKLDWWKTQWSPLLFRVQILRGGLSPLSLWPTFRICQQRGHIFLNGLKLQFLNILSDLSGVVLCLKLGEDRTWRKTFVSRDCDTV